MHESLFQLINFIIEHNGIGNKSVLIEQVQKRFELTLDRVVYYSEHYAIRFSYSSSTSFSNTVISLSALQKYDDQPFLVCLVTPEKNILYLANSTFLIKVSHSSQQLRTDNIKGSINGSDIAKEFNGLSNSPENFEKLFSIHAELGFNDNLARLVEATNNISPTGIKFRVLSVTEEIIKSAPERAVEFVNSREYIQLKSELDEKVSQYKNEILIAGFIENTYIPMPEGDYPCTAEIYTATWKRSRWPWAVNIDRVKIEIPGGIPVPGHPDSDFFDGDDSTYEITLNAYSIDHARMEIRQDVMAERRKYGGDDWVPDEGWPKHCIPLDN